MYSHIIVYVQVHCICIGTRKFGAVCMQRNSAIELDCSHTHLVFLLVEGHGNGYLQVVFLLGLGVVSTSPGHLEGGREGGREGRELYTLHVHVHTRIQKVLGSHPSWSPNFLSSGISNPSLCSLRSL